MSSKTRKFLIVFLALWGLTAVALHAGVSPDFLLRWNPLFCAFNFLTGIPCPGCGMTRAFLALAGGNVVQAFHFNPWSLPLLAGLILASFRISLPKTVRGPVYSVGCLLVFSWWIGFRLIPHLSKMMLG